MKIAVFCCDLYADIAPAWLHLWRKHWPDCDYEAVFVTNSQPLDVDVPVYYIRGEDIHYGWRLRTFLGDYYTREHILITMADYLIKSVDAPLIARAHELCALPRVRHVRLRPMPQPPFDYIEPGFGRIDKQARYSLSLQPGIWEAQTLYDLVDDGWDPWQCEVLGSLRVRKLRGQFLSVDRLAMPFVHYYRKGKPDGVNWVMKQVPPDKWPDAAREEV